MFRAQQTGASVEARRVKLVRDERTSWINMTVRPFHDLGIKADLFLVLFDEVQERMADEGEPGMRGQDPVLVQLERELQHSREQLSTTIEQYETSMEELKASNEELQAINEELRSATEELESSKEELQSVNEELSTVNAELQARVEDTAKANDDLQNIIVSTEIATVFVDKRIQVKRFTPSATRIFNLIEKDVGRSLFDITRALKRPTLAEDVKEAFESLKLIERKVESADGHWYLMRLLPYRTADDRIDGAVLTLIDVTARHQAEEQARTGEQRLRLAAQATSEFAIVVAEPDGRIVSWNAGAERIFGYAEAEVIGRDIALIYEAADREAALPPRERELAAAEGHVDDERWYVTKDHRRIYCSGVVTQIVDASFRGFAKIVRDLTVRKLQESARDPSGAHVPQESALQTTGKPLTDEFIAVLSQELKRPLNLIGIKAEMPPRLPETRGIEAVHAAASSIRQAVGSQAQTIDDLLELSRVAADKLVLDLQPVDLAAMLSDIAAAAAVDANARGISLSVSGTQQPAMTLADPVRSEQILWNLVANALKFTDDGGRIELRLARDDHALHIEVADDGQGIDAAELPHVFDMFRRRRRDRANDGLGIGLAKQLGELQGGDVTAASAGAGSGATLSVRLPALAARDTGGVLTAAAQSVAGVRMLVVCEDEETASSIASLLRLEHADVQVASNADTALICSPGIRRTRCCAKRRCRAGKAMRLCEGSRPTRHSRT